MPPAATMEHEELDHPASARHRMENDATVEDKHESFRSPPQPLPEHQPPYAQPHGEPTPGVSGASQPTMIRRTIRPSRSKTKLMRQVSALGMEDPVFRTTESGPEHPSNIFDDMGANHISPDMMDMVSIASDPTAVMGEGCDIHVFQMSLSTQQGSSFLEESGIAAAVPLRPCLIEFGTSTGTTHSLPLNRPSRSLLSNSHHEPNHHAVPVSPEPKLDPFLSSSYHPPSGGPVLQRRLALRGTNQSNQLNQSNTSFNKMQSQSFTHQPPNAPPHRSRHGSPPSPLKANHALRLTRKPSHDMNASLPSLDLDAVFGASHSHTLVAASQSQLPTTTPHPNGPPRHLKKRGGGTSAMANMTIMGATATTDTLLAEAAMALQEQGSACLELIEAAKQQHHSTNHYTNHHTMSTTSSPQPPPGRRVSRRHSTGIFPILEHYASAVGTPNDAVITMSNRRLPTMSNLFPGTSRVPSRTLSAESHGTRASQRSAFSRRKSADGDYTPTKIMYTEYQPHQSWNVSPTRSKNQAVMDRAFV